MLDKPDFMKFDSSPLLDKPDFMKFDSSLMLDKPDFIMSDYIISSMLYLIFIF